MLRPATPLSIFLLASFILLLISVLSTPIIKSIPLARYDNVNFGVFGWCKDDGTCSGISVGWNIEEAIPPNEDRNWSLPSGARRSLSSLLIVHVVAAFCNLIALGLAIAAHFHSPSHSARYLLGLLIFLLPTLLVTLLAFLVDILLFVPDIRWAGWIVLASTILITVSGVVTCAMRRTLVSRKARKKRIAENAEMSGENFYARQAQESKVVTPAISSESRAPLMHGASGSDRLPEFATYSSSRNSEIPAPSRPARSSQEMNGSSPASNGRFYGPPSRTNTDPKPVDFGAPLGASRSAEDRSPMSYNGRGGYGPPRGRGGYPPRGSMTPRGGYGPRGPPPQAYGRGGYPSRGRGGFGPGRQPPPGYPPQGPQSGPERYGTPNQMNNGPIPYVQPDQPEYETHASSIYSDERDKTRSPYHGQRDISPPIAMSHSNEAQHPTLPILPTDQEEYVPPRSGWEQHSTVSPPHSPNRPRANSRGSNYIEDVDPRFAEQDAPPLPPPIPRSLTAGRVQENLHAEHDPSLQPATSYENLSGNRSPDAASEASEFTSISQRGVNPNWRPGNGGEFNSFGPMRRHQQQQRQDMLLAGNPDFELPGMGPQTRIPMRGGGGGGGRGGYRGGMMMGGPPGRPLPPSALGMGGDGRYPAESPPLPPPGMTREI